MDVKIMVGGEAGDGILTTGDLIAKILQRIGLEVYTYKNFPSRIRGGHTSYLVRGRDKWVMSRGNNIDVLIAFDFKTIFRHEKELSKEGFVIFDNSKENLEKSSTIVYQVPMRKMAQELGMEVVKNTISLGVLACILKMDVKTVRNFIYEYYKKKSKEIGELNLKAFDLGCEFGSKIEKKDKHKVGGKKKSEKYLMMGNEAVALGALTAGCRFLAAYPITPATEILEKLVKILPKYGGVVVQTEDEIAAINMALGASFVGARAMTSTSGPGLSLMTEAIGLAAGAEIPIVIVVAQRPGPSTGLPTKTEQGDLNHVIFGGHGDFPRIVLAPATVEDCFYVTVKAFNLAEKYQCPVFVLIEQCISQNKQTVDKFDFNVEIDRGKLLRKADENFKRYEFTEDGVSPRTIPGVENGIFLATGNEHNEDGNISEDKKIRKKMMDKRMKKLALVERDAIPPILLDEDSEFGVVAFGSTYGPILEALDCLKEKGYRIKYLHLKTLWPFPKLEIEKFFEKSSKIFIVENNKTGQLANLVRRVVGNSEKIHQVLKYDGRAFRPSEISKEIEKVIL